MRREGGRGREGEEEGRVREGGKGGRERELIERTNIIDTEVVTPICCD